MKKIVVASHHKLAFGMKEAIEFLTGYKGIIELSAYIKSGDISEEVKKIMQTINEDDEVFIFTDILGGSVTQAFYPYINEKIHMICGMNLPLILTFLEEIDSQIDKEKINEIIQEVRESIIYINDYSTTEDEIDE